jgi:hypothetical protein
MNGAVKSFFDGLKDRVSNPFIFTYIGVYIFRRWDAFFHLFFGAESLKVRITTFKELGYHWYDGQALLFTLVLIFALPLLNMLSTVAINIPEWLWGRSSKQVQALNTEIKQLTEVNLSLSEKYRESNKSADTQIALIEDSKKKILKFETELNQAAITKSSMENEFNLVSSRYNQLIKEVSEVSKSIEYSNSVNTSLKEIITNLTVNSLNWVKNYKYNYTTPSEIASIFDKFKETITLVGEHINEVEIPQEFTNDVRIPIKKIKINKLID